MNQPVSSHDGNIKTGVHTKNNRQSKEHLDHPTVFGSGKEVYQTKFAVQAETEWMW